MERETCRETHKCLGLDSEKWMCGDGGESDQQASIKACEKRLVKKTHKSLPLNSEI